MKILEAQSAVLSNAEVLHHLQQIQARRQAQAGPRGVPQLKSPNFETIVKELTAYLQPDASISTSHGSSSQNTQHQHQHPHQQQPSPLPDYAGDYDAAAIRRCMERLEPFHLTKAELVMLLNLRPGNIARLDAVVEEMDARLDPAQQEEVLAIVGEALTAQNTDGRNGEGGGAGGGAAERRG